MTACESSRSSPGQSERLGLAQAFILAGSQAVLAADVPIPDELAHRFGVAWAEALAAGKSPEAAWLAAANKSSNAIPDSTWWNIRLWIP
jgi:hypothetical protein